MKNWKMTIGRIGAIILSVSLVLGEVSIPVWAGENTQAQTAAADTEAADEAPEEAGEETAEAVPEEAGEETAEAVPEEAAVKAPEEADDEDNAGETAEDVREDVSDMDTAASDVQTDRNGAQEENSAASENAVSGNSASDNSVSDNFFPEEAEQTAGEMQWEEENLLMEKQTISSNNYNSQNYTRWSSTVKSYLVHLDDGRYMRVEALGDELLIEYYNSAFQKQSSRTLQQKHDLFGGFYAGQNYYYVVYGKNNNEEKDSNLVMEVVKYDTSWKNIMSEKIYGSNTQIPFKAGSLRMAEYDGQLYIRTSHTMYKNKKDKLNHQANWTLQIREADMQLIDSTYTVSDQHNGYVSHSFNQFILVDDNQNIVALDHGDAYPRGILIGKYVNPAGRDSFVSSYANKEVLQFEGNIGNNSTGASIGGFTYSSDNYLIAGNTVERGDGWEQRTVRNVFIITAAKDDFSGVKRRNLTDYDTSDQITTTTPHLVKIRDDRFLLLWGLLGNMGNGQMSYVFLDGNGKTTSKIYTVNGYLSDCEPVSVEDKVVWYSTSQGKITFYLINEDGSFSVLKEGETGGTGEYFETSLLAATTCTIAKQYYTSKEIIPSDEAVNLVVGGRRLKQGKDYRITCTNNIEIGQATAVLKGIGKYQDSRTITFKIAARPLSRVQLDLTDYMPSFTYDGTAKTQSLQLYVKSGDDIIYLKEGEDYFVRHYNNMDAGTASVTYTGIGNFTGTKSKTYKIRKLDITFRDEITSTLPSSYTYMKGGIKTALKTDAKIYYKGELLRLNKDYTLLYRNYNPSRCYEGAVQGVLVVKGKGNFTGKKEIRFTIQAKELSEVNVKVTDKVYRPVEGNYRIIPSLKDSNGKSLTKKKDYSTNFEYYVDGRRLGPDEIVAPGTEVTVITRAVEGSMYTGEISARYRVVDKSIAKAKISCISEVIYVTYDGVLLKEGVDYEIVSKTLNKSQRAYKLEIHGLGTYGRTKNKTVTRK